MLKTRKLTLWKVSGVNDTLGHIFLGKSLSDTRISESVKPSDSYPETPRSSTPTTTSTSSSSSSTSASVPASISHTPPTSIGPSGHPTGLSSPLSPATFSSGISKVGGETGAWTTYSVSTSDEPWSPSRMMLFSDMLWNSTRRTWLTGYDMVDLKFHSWNSLAFLFFLWPICLPAMTSSSYFQGYVEERDSSFFIFNFHSLICLPFINFSYTANYSTSAIKMLQRDLQSISRLVTQFI